MGSQAKRSTRRVSAGLVLTLLARVLVLPAATAAFTVALPAEEAYAAEVPLAGSPYYLQTNGPNGASSLGDWYTNSSGGNRDHLMAFTVPCTWPSSAPIQVDLFSPAMTDAGVTAGRDERTGTDLDPTYFELHGPFADPASALSPRPARGTGAYNRTFAPNTGGENWVRFATVGGPAGTGVVPFACGTYLVRSAVTGTEANDQNGWRIRVGRDGDADPNNAPPANNDDADGVSGTGDELALGLYETTFQHGQGTSTCLDLYEFVAGGEDATFNNFDMDGNVSVAYTAPDGQSFGGTLSGNDVWNGGTNANRAGDTFSVATSGYWTLTSCANGNNQFIQEGGLVRLAQFTRPAEPRVRVAKTDGLATATEGSTLSYDVDITNDATAPNPGAALDVVVTDTLPAGTTFQSCAWTAPATGTCGESAPGTVTATLASPLAAGAAARLVINATVDTGTTGALTNQVSVAYTDVASSPWPAITASDSTFVGDTTICYGVADQGPNGGADHLVEIDRATGTVKEGKDIAGSNGAIEAIAMSPGAVELFGFDGGRFGRIDRATGAFTVINGDVDGPGGARVPGGGTVQINDVDGLSFDPYTGRLWGSEREGGNDLILLIDPVSGQIVRNAFVDGAGQPVDALRVTGSLGDIDDIAIDPTSGILYGVSNSGGTTDQLVRIDKRTGVATELGPFFEVATSTPVTDVEGLSFGDDGTLYASTGNNGPTSTNNRLYAVDVSNGNTVEAGVFTSGNDYEALACQTSTTGTNDILGTVFEDGDQDGVLDAAEVGRQGVRVQLYQDLNRDGAVDAGDRFLDQVITDASGRYGWSPSVLADFVISIQQADLPSGSVLTTPTYRAAAFATFGNVDAGNDFGYFPPSDLAITKVARAPGGGPLSLPLVPGQRIEYQVVVTNNATVTQTGIQVLDPVPTGTRFDPDPATNSVVSPRSVSARESWTSVGYGGGTGWNSASWAEANDSNGASGGDARVEEDPVDKDPDLALRVNKDAIVSRTVDLRGLTGATLTFVHSRDKDGDNDSGLRVDVGAASFGPYEGSKDVNRTRTIDLTPYVGAIRTVSFRLADQDDDSRNHVDDIVITGTGTTVENTGDLNAGQPVTSGKTLRAGESLTATFQVVVDDPVAVGTIDNTATATSDQEPSRSASTSDPVEATIGDLVWEDRDGDGAYDPAVDVGVSGVTVRVTGAGADRTFGTADDTSATAITDATGAYLVGQLAAGDYRVTPVSGVPARLTQLATTTDPFTVTLSPGQDERGADFGYEELVQLTLDKTADTTTPEVGGRVLFTLRVENQGPGAATGVAVTDTLPAGVTFDGDIVDAGESATSGSITAWDPTTGVFTWSIPGPIPASGVEVLSFAVTNDDVASKTNRAEITAADQRDPTSDPAEDATIGNEDDEDTVVLTPRRADLEVTKTVDVATPRPGTAITYSVEVRNRGPDAAADVVLTDVLPSRVTFRSFANASPVAPAPTYDAATRTVTWELGSLADGAVASVDIVADVATTVAGTPITNTATVTSTTSDPGAFPNSASVVIDPVVIDLELSKTASPAAPEVGDTVTYTLTLDNVGPDGATGIEVRDELPSGLRFISSADVTETSPGSGVLVWRVGSLAASGTVTATYDVQLTSGGSLVNSAQVTAANEYDRDSNPDDGVGDDADRVSFDVDEIDLELDKRASNAAPQVGEVFTFVIDVTNRGPDPASDVTVAEDVPAGLVLVSWSATSGSYDPMSDTWTVGGVGVGATASLTLTVRADSPGTFVNDAEVASATQFDVDSTPDSLGGGAPDPAEDDEDRVSVTTQTIDLALAKTVDVASPNVGETVTFTLTADNVDGVDDATGVVVTDRLPAGMTYAGSIDPAVSHSGGLVTWTVGALPAGTGTASTTFTATVTSRNALRNVAEVAAADQFDVDSTEGDLFTRLADPYTSPPASFQDDEAFVALTPQVADLSLTKRVTSNPRPRVGQTVEFTLQLSNAGPSTATGIVVTEELPAGLSYTGDYSATGFDPTTERWSIASLASGATASLVITATVDADGSFTNTAEVTAVAQADADSTPGNYAAAPTEDDGAAVTVTTQLIDLELSKVVTSGTATPNVGDTVEFTLTVVNTSSTDAATGVQVTDLLPAGLSYSGTYDPAVFDTSTGVWTVGRLERSGTAGDRASLVIRTRVDATGQQINRAEVTAADQTDVDSQPDEDAVVPNQDDEAQASVTPQVADLSLTKILSAPVAPRFGDVVTYTLEVTNGATADPATNVTVRDLLPAALSYVSDSAPGAYDPATGIWTVGTVAPGATVSLTIDAEVVDTGLVVNDAEVWSLDQADADSSPANLDPAADPSTFEDDEARVTTTVGPAADLELAKSVNDSEPNPGQDVVFTLRLTNQGPDSAAPVAVTDLLDASSFLYVSDDSATTGTTYDPLSGVWDIPSLAAGGTIELRITANVIATTDADNVAEVTASSVYDPDSTPGNGSAVEDDRAVVTLFPNEADLAVAKTVASGSSATPNVGDTVGFDIRVTNNGPDTATGVVINDAVPAGTTFISATPPAGGSYDPTSGDWTLGGPLANGASATLRLVLRVDGPTPFDNVASVGFLRQNDPIGTNDSARVSIRPARADVSLTKTVDVARPDVGDTISFTITARNAGPEAATGITVSDALPAGLAFVNATPSGSTNYFAGSETWTIASLAPGASETLTLVARVTTSTPKTNTATVTSLDQYDPDTADQTASVTVTPRVVDLSVSKTATNPNSPAQPDLGDTVTYTVRVSNAAGVDTATGVVLTDRLPAGVTVLDPAGGTYDAGAGTITWMVPSLLPGASQSFVFTARLDDTGAQVNAAEVTAQDQADRDSAPAENGTVGDEDDEATVTVGARQVDLELAKSVSPGPYGLGRAIVYTLSLTNRGPDGASNVSVRDVLPSELTFVSSAGGSYAADVWNVGTVAVGQTATLTITARVDETGPIGNTAEVIAADQVDLDSTPDNDVPAEDDQSSADIVVPATADLSLTKTVDEPRPNVGDQVTFTVTLDNEGPDTATGIRVSDPVPTGLRFDRVVASSGSYAAGVWTVPSLAPSDPPATLTVVATVMAADAAPNVAEIVAADQPDTDSIPGSGPGEDDYAAVGVSPKQVDLSLTKDRSPLSPTTTPSVGETFIYRLTVTNAGPDTATGVTARDILPAGKVAFVASAGDGSFDANTKLWSIGTLVPGATVTRDITVTVTGSGTFANVARVESVTEDDVDSTPGNDVPAEDDQDDHPLTVAASADLAVTKSVSDTSPNVGDQVVFTIQVTNQGPDAASGVVVTDQLPAGLTYVADDVTGYDETTGDWTVGALAVGATRTLRITATVDASGAIVNVAEVTAADQEDRDSRPGNHASAPTEDDSAETTLTAQAVDVSLSKTLRTGTPTLGGTVTFDVTVTNAVSVDAATNVVVTDTLPAGLVFASATRTAGTFVPVTGRWSLASLAPGASETLTITATVTRTGTLTNSAEVTAHDQADVDSTPANGDPLEDDQASAEVVVPATVDLSVAKSVDDPTPNVGQTVEYTIELDNAGPDRATGVTVQDTLDAGLAFVSATAPAGTTFDATTGVWDVGTIDVETLTLTLRATVTSTATLTNTAYVRTQTETDVDSAPGTADTTQDDAASVEVSAREIDLSISKTVDDAAPALDDRVTFSVALTNGGPDTATGIRVRDLLPAGLSFVSASATRGGYASATGLWSVPTLSSGETIRLDLVADVTATGTITNVAEVVAADQFDTDSSPTDPDPLEDDTDAQAIVVPRTVDLEVDKTVADAATPLLGTTTFDVVLTNRGPDDATGITLQDRYPAGLAVTNAGGGTHDSVARTVTWSGIDLAAGASTTRTITVQVVSVGTQTNVAEVLTADQPDRDSTYGNDVLAEDDQDNAAIRAPVADLAVDKRLLTVAPFTVGDTIRFQVDVTNVAPGDPATGVAVLDEVVPGFEFVDADTGGAGTYDPATGQWNVGSLAPGQTETLLLDLRVTTPDPVTNTATVSASDAADQNPANDTDSVQVDAQDADLELTKDVAPGAVAQLGDTATYTVTLTNNGPDTARSTVVRDVLPAVSRFAVTSVTASTGTWSAPNWTVPTLDPGQTTTLTIVGTVRAPGAITNTAEIISTNQFDRDSIPANGDTGEDDRDSATVTGPATVDLSLAKTGPAGPVDLGDLVTFQLTVANAGPSTATGVVVTDRLPAGLTFDSAPPSVTPVAGALRWNVGSVGVGATRTVAITARASGTGLQTNLAEISAHVEPDRDSTPENDLADKSEATQDDEAFADVLVAPSADLSLTKAVDQTAPNPGDTVTFTLTLRNAGPDDATNVTVADDLPATLAYGTTVPGSDGTFDGATWTVGTIAAGATATLAFTAEVLSGGEITNRAQVQTSDQFDPDSAPGNGIDTEDDQDSATLNAGLADLRVLKVVDPASSTTPSVGDTVVFDITVDNLGPDTATTIRVTDLVPAGLAYAGHVGPGSYDPTSGVWQVPDLLSGQLATLELATTVVDSGVITNTAQVLDLDQDDPVAANDAAAATLDVPAAIDLSVTKSVSDPTPAVGDVITYTVAVSNAGPDPASGVVVTDRAPSGIRFDAADDPAFSIATGAWSVGALAVGETRTVVIAATVTGSNAGTNVAQVTAADQADVDSTPGNYVASDPNEDDEAEVGVAAQQVDLSLLKSVVGSASPTLGDRATFRVTVTNAGPSDATGVTVRDRLPAGSSFVSTTGSYDPASDPEIWTLGTVPAGQSRSYDVVVDITGTGTITNLAQVAAVDQPDLDSTPDDRDPAGTAAPDDDEDTATLTVPAAIDLSVTKTANVAAANDGDPVTFTVTVTNDGPDEATGVRLRDALPTGLTYVSDSATQGSYSPATGVWNVGDLAARGSATLSLTAAMASTTPVVNRVEVTAADQVDVDSTPDNGVATEDDRASVTVRPNVADLRLTKTVDNASPALNDEVRFTLTLVNDGPQPATNVTVSDPVPVGFTFVSTDPAYDPSTGTWNVGTVDPGVANARTLVIRATVETTDPVANVAQVQSSDQADPDSTPGNSVSGEDDQARASLNAVSADLAVTKTADVADAFVGDTVTFTITVTNQAGDPATGVSVRDQVPSGLRVLSSSADQGSYDQTSGVWTVGALPVTVTRTLTIVTEVVSGGDITNVAEVASSDQIDPDSTPADFDPTRPAQDDEDTADVTIPLPASIGDTVFRDINGNGTREVGEPGIDGVRVTLTGPGGPRVVTTSGGGRYLFDLLPAGTYTVDVDESSAPVAGQVLTTTNDPIFVTVGEGEDQLTIDFGFRAEVDVSLTHTVTSDPDPAVVGGEATFVVTVTNQGPSTATGVVAEHVLPSGLTAITRTPSQGSTSGSSWSVGTLAPGASATLTVVASIDASGSYTVPAQVTATDQHDIDSTPGVAVPGDDDEATQVLVVPPAIDLELGKSVDVVSPTPGQDVTFTVTLSNAGPDDATGVTVLDRVPARSSFVSATPSRGTYDSGTGIWNVGGLLRGETATLDVRVTPDAGATVTNTAQVRTANEADVDSTPGNSVAGEDDQDSAATNPPVSDLAVTKTVDDPTPTVGEDVTFTVTVRNLGPDPATSVALLDQITSGFGYVSHTATGGTFTPGNGVWDLGGLANGDSEQLTLTVTARTDSPTTNIASVESNDSFDGNPANDQDQETVDATLVDLDLTKTARDPAPSYGDEVVFDLTVSNQGPDPATGVVVTDRLPTGLTYVPGSAGPSYDPATGRWAVGTLSAGERRTLAIRATAGSVGTFTNTAQVTAQDQTDADSLPGNSIASEDDQDSATVTTPPAASLGDLVFLDADGNGVQGSPAVEPGIDGATVTLTYAGPDDTFGTGDDEVLASDVTDAAGGYGFGSLPAGFYSVDVDRASLPVGYAPTNTVPRVVQLSAGQDLRTVDLGFRPQLDIAVTKTADDVTPNPGQQVRFRITAANLGPADATGLVVRDRLPTGLTYVSADGPYDPSTGDWTVGALAASTSRTLTVIARVDDVGPLTNAARVQRLDQVDADPTNDRDEVTLSANQVDLVLTNVVDDAAPDLNDTVTFTVSVTNESSTDATGVVVSAPVPSTLSSVSSDAGPDYVVGTGLWTVGDLAAGATRTLVITATAGTVGRSQVVAQVDSLDQADTDSVPGNDDEAEDDQQTASVTPVAIDLSVAKDAAPVAPVVGDSVTYEVVVSNAGPADATGVVVSDPLPTGVTFTSATATIGSYDETTGLWVLGAPLAAGRSATLEIVASVDRGGSITNLAEVSAADQVDVDSTPGNASSTVEDDEDIATINGVTADLELDKSASAITPAVGDRLAYVITLTHASGQAADGVTVSDVLPSQVSFVGAVADQGSYDETTGIWNVGTVNPGEVLDLTITVTVDVPGSIDNTAEISTSRAFDPDSTPGNGPQTTPEDDRDVVTVTAPVPSSIGDLVFTDLDADGIQDPGEDGIAGVEVTLIDPGVDATFGTADDVVVVDTTDGSGRYLFDGLSAGAYRVSVDPAAAPLSGLANTTATSQDVTITADRDLRTVDFGFRAETDVALNQSVSTGTPDIGEQVTFTIVVTNQSTTDATGIDVEQVLPPGLTFVSALASQGGATHVAGTVDWTVGEVAARGRATLTVVAIAAASGSYQVRARVQTTTEFDVDSTPGNAVEAEDDQQTVALTVAPRADLSLTKSVDNPDPAPGSPATFTLRLSNAGPDGATGVTVSDPLPAGLRLVGSSPDRGTYAAGTWDVGPIARGETLELDLVVEPDGTVADGTPIVNTAEVATSDQADADSTPGNAAAGEDDIGSAAIDPTTADLRVTKRVDDATPTVGDLVTFTVSVTNDGPDAAAGVAVRDLLPPTDFALVSSTPPAGQSYDPVTGAWAVGDLANGETATLLLEARVLGDAPATNVATVAGTSARDPRPGNDRAEVTVDATQADLSLSKTVDDDTPPFGGRVTFTLTLANGGPDEATGVAVVDLLPTGLEHVSDSGSYDPATGVWTVGSLASDATASLTITADVTGVGPLTNEARVQTSDQHDPDSVPGNDVLAEDDQAQAVVTGPAPSSIAGTVYADVDRSQVREPGEAGINGVTVTLTGPGPDGTLGTADDTVTTEVTGVDGSYRFGQLGPGDHVISVPNSIRGVDVTTASTRTVTIAAPEDVTDQDFGYERAVALPSGPGPIPAPAPDPDPTIDLELTKTVDTVTAAAGEMVAFDLVVTNEGPDDATGVQVRDLLPAGLTFDGSTGDGAYDPVSGTWKLGAVPAGATATHTIVATFDSTSDVTNVAEIVAAGEQDTDSTPDNGVPSEDDRASATVSVGEPAPDLEIVKAVSPESVVLLGDELAFTITVRNSGAATATDVVLTDPTPARSTFVPGSATVDGQPVDDVPTGDGNPFAAGLPVGDLPVGESLTATFRVVAGGPAGGVIDNIAFVEGAGVSRVASTAASVVVVSGSTVRIEKSADRAITAVGQRVTWSVIVTNVGTTPLATINVIDEAPQGTSYVPGSTAIDGAPVADVDATTPLATGLVVGPLAPAESATVTFRTEVESTQAGLTIQNVAAARDDETQLTSNQVILTVESPTELPRTGLAIDLERTGPIAVVMLLGGWMLLYVARPQRKARVPRPGEDPEADLEGPWY